MPYNRFTMTNLENSFWNINGNDISLNMSIQKVDKERRLVSGWATTDTLDKHGDIVSIDASTEAFSNFLGNVREMHTPLSVGKVVNVRRDTFWNKSTNSVNNGIFVDVYISKGAEDTWLKINEGVLTGFSIGGVVTDKETVYNKDIEGPVTVIKGYRLNELSVVDNPANGESNFVSIQKIGDKAMEKNFLENIFFCNPNDPVIVSEKSDYDCPSCEKKMKNIGYVETNDAEKGMVIKALIAKYEGAIDAEVIANNNEKEGEKVENTTEETAATEVAEAVAEEAVAEETKTEEAVAKSADETVVEEAPAAEEATTEEVVAETEVEVEKSTTPVESDEELAKAVDEVREIAKSTTEAIAEMVKGFSQAIEDLKKSVTEEMTGVKASVQEFGKRVDAVEGETAIRKSGDLGGVGITEEKIEKSKWDGRFLNSADLPRYAR